MTDTDRSVAFLRAINVGGRRVTMADLTGALRSAGLPIVGTHLASGNVVVEGSSVDGASIEQAIEQAFGFRSEAFVRSAAEVWSVIERSPWSPSEHLVAVSFLERAPDPERARTLEASVHEPEAIVVSGREAYLRRGDRGHPDGHEEVATQRALAMSSTRRGMSTITGIAERYLSG